MLLWHWNVPAAEDALLYHEFHTDSGMSLGACWRGSKASEAARVDAIKGTGESPVVT
jgi:hypothetical protein